MKNINFKLMISLLVIALFAIATGTYFASPAIGLATGLSITAIGMIPREAGAAFMATPDTSALAAYAGKFENALFSTLRARLTILNDLTVLPGIKNILNLTKLTVADGVRGYREDFDSSDSDLKYSGRALATTLLKRDIKINPLKYRSTWMSQVMKPGVNPNDFPFYVFVNNSIMEQIASEIQRGAYLAVKGDESTLAKSFDGLGTIIAAEIAKEVANAGTGIVPIATGALSETNAVAKFEQMVASMPSDFVDAGFPIFASIESARKYNTDYRERYGKFQEKDEKGNLIIDNTAGKVLIKPVSWMGTSGRLIASPTENLLAGVDALGDMDKIHTDLELEIIKYRVLFALGFQVRDKDAMRVNDQA
jgi:hypothetical protein